jgi:hypothetical protein
MLAELQSDFARAVRGDAVAVPRLGIDAVGLTAERRVAVYRNHHQISLAAALAANFPTVVKLVGDPAFHALAVSFLTVAPPRDPCLAAYGAELPGFLEGDPRSQSLAYLGDVARLDWAINLAERADDLPAFDAQDLARMDPADLESLVLAPHPSLTLLQSRYPLLRIRALAAGLQDEVSLDEGGSRLMVWRRQDAVACTALDGDQFDFVRAISEGVALGSAAALLPPERLAVSIADHLVQAAFVSAQRDCGS